MKNRDLELRPHFTRGATPAELYALERAAKEARATEIARLFRVAFDGVKTLFSATETKPKGIQHA